MKAIENGILRLGPAWALLVVLGTSTVARADSAGSDGIVLFDSRDLSVSLKALDQDKGNVGIDYKLALKKNLTEVDLKKALPALDDWLDFTSRTSLDIRSDGFLTVTSRENRANSILSQASLTLAPLWRIERKAPAAAPGAGGIAGVVAAVQACFTQDDYAKLQHNYGAELGKFLAVPGVALQVANGLQCLIIPDHLERYRDDLGGAYEEIVARLPPNGIEKVLDEFRRMRQRYDSPLWIDGNLHFKHEATQDFDDYDLAGGAGISITTVYLSQLLDLPFGLLRSGKNNGSRQLDVSLSYDYVGKMDQTGRATVRGDDTEANRLNARAEWETGILRSERLSLVYDAYYEFDAPPSVRQGGKDYGAFFLAKLEHLLFEYKDAKTQVALIYTNGELPPNFEGGSVLGAGFSLYFPPGM
ncbi:MAG: hypothetical protein HY699_14215 [Deltaproteobacteria bacterium]|nr:hypothetical protein [Deltaproteobacteria bacterium]